MKTKIVGTMILIANLMLSCCFAAKVSTQETSNQTNFILWEDLRETPVLKKIDRRQLKIITKVMPDEFNNYHKQLKNDLDMNDAKLSLSLVLRADDLRKQNSDPNHQEDFNRTYYTTWVLTTEVMQKTKNPEVKKLILENWNSYLKKDDKSVPYQIYAVIGHDDPNQDRGFFTEDFWKLLEKTKNKKTISAISFVVFGCGNREDYKRLEDKKREPGIDKESHGFINRALSWMRYRFSHDKNDPGPSFGRPRMTFIDEYQDPNSKSVEKQL